MNSVYVAPKTQKALKPPEGAQKRKMAAFCMKVDFIRRKTATEFS